MHPQIHQIAAPGGKIRKIAYLHREAAPGKPGVFWLPGFNSRMTSQKGEAVARWCGERGLSCLRFDYSGRGSSSGTLEDGVIGDWLEEAAEIFTRYAAGPQIIGASSMGGWLALLLAKRLDAGRIKAIVTIAPACDMTEALMWAQLPEEARQAVLRDGVYYVPSDYEDGGYPITRALIEDGRAHLIGGAPFDPGCPVRILHGMRDASVPWRRSLELAELLTGDDVRLTLIKDGDHRLARDCDMALLFAGLGEFAG